jgi:iron complex outermembrane receptor protein
VLPEVLVQNLSIFYAFRGSFIPGSETLKTDKFDRLTTAINLSPKFFNDHLAVNVNFKYSKTQKRFADEGALVLLLHLILHNMFVTTT